MLTNGANGCIRKVSPTKYILAAYLYARVRGINRQLVVSVYDAILSAQCPPAIIPLAQPYELSHGDHADVFKYSSRNPKC